MEVVRAGDEVVYAGSGWPNFVGQAGTAVSFNSAVKYLEVRMPCGTYLAAPLSDWRISPDVRYTRLLLVDPDTGRGIEYFRRIEGKHLCFFPEGL
jgi:hypothetical protein